MFGKYPGAYCIGLQRLSYKFCKTIDWLNPHNDYNEVPQSFEK